jgi:hypothetical protein
MTKHGEESPPPCRLAFAELVRQPEAAIDVAEATLLIAKEEYPGLDVAADLERLDRMERENRRLKRWGVVALVGIAAAVLMGQAWYGNVIGAERFIRLITGWSQVRVLLGSPQRSHSDSPRDASYVGFLLVARA